MIERCLNCKFAFEDNTTILCRRNPPTVMLTEIKKVAGKITEIGHWTQFPTMQPSGWCGEWKLKPEMVQ